MSRSALLVASVLFCCGAAWLNWHWLQAPIDISPIASRAPAKIPAEKDSSSDALGFDFPSEMGESLARPLFHSNRRPSTPPVAEPVEVPVIEETTVVEQQPPQPLPTQEFRIAGISVFGGEKHALLGHNGADELRWFAEGDDVGGWIIASITSETVILAAGDQSFLLSLYPNASPEGTN